jgi:hypothetical protein
MRPIVLSHLPREILGALIILAPIALLLALEISGWY